MPSDHESTQEGAEGGGEGTQFRFPHWLALIALLLGVGYEILFFGHPMGISFPILAVLCAAALLGAARMEGIRFSWGSVSLVLPILFFAIFTAFRLEPLTAFLNVTTTLALFALWVRTFRTGSALDFGWLDYLVALIWVPLESWIRPWRVMGAAQSRIFKEGERRGLLLAILRGLLLALPILVVLLALLTAADLVYADRVEKALEWLDLERLAEYGARTLMVVFSAIFFLGALVIALRESGERKLIGAEKPLVGPLLGSIEIMVVLSLVDLLFATFVGFQFTYLFGGEANITAAGYTYSEYARRGFGELVAVGVLSLGLILLFAYFGKRESRAAQGWFKGLSALLVLEVGVILASALRRLLLYEGAYGFTRLRTYTHLFIPWMGLLLVAFLVLLFMRRVRRIAPAAVIVSLGFVATMNIVNVDAFIVRRNVARLRETGDIDLTYLASLSEDAVPALIDLARTGSEEVRAELLPELACWEEQLEERASSLGWPSTHFSRLSARKAFSRVEREWVGTEVVKSRGYWYFKEAKEDVPCGHQSWLGWID